MTRRTVWAVVISCMLARSFLALFVLGSSAIACLIFRYEGAATLSSDAAQKKTRCSGCANVLIFPMLLTAASLGRLHLYILITISLVLDFQMHLVLHPRIL